MTRTFLGREVCCLAYIILRQTAATSHMTTLLNFAPGLTLLVFTEHKGLVCALEQVPLLSYFFLFLRSMLPVKTGRLKPQGKNKITKIVCSRRGYRLHQTNILTLQSKGGHEQTDGATGEGEHLGAEGKSGSRTSGFCSGAGGC